MNIGSFTSKKGAERTLGNSEGSALLPSGPTRDVGELRSQKMEQRLNRLIRISDLPLYVGLKRTKIRELIKAGEFPRAIPLSDSGRAVAWLEADIASWQARRLAKRESECA